MKTARRMLALLLALLMTAALVACGKGSEATNTDSASVGSNTSTQTGDGTIVDGEPPFQLPDRPTSETNGQTYVIIQHSDEADPFGYKADSLHAEQALARVEEVQETYGCTLTFTKMAYNESFITSIQQAQYGDGGDIVFSSNNAMLRRTLGTGGDTSFMTDLLTLDHILNFWDENKWGNITAKETMMAGGHFYGVSPALWVECTPLPFYLIVYNKDLLEQFGVTDLQEYWEKEEWDRDNMLDAITSCYDNTGADVIWGMSADLSHMIRATFLASGSTTVVINSVNADGTVDWSRGLDSENAVEALGWLKTSLNSNKQYFNNGKDSWATWDSQTPFIAGQCAMCLTRPQTFFQDISVAVENFGLMTWAGADANFMSGYYENCYSVAIPIFAQNAEHSAFLMYDLFEGLGDISTYDDIVALYRQDYFETDIDVDILFRKGANLQYSYWPNGCDDVWGQLKGSLLSAGSVASVVAKYSGVCDTQVQTYIVENQKALEAYRQQGKFD